MIRNNKNLNRIRNKNKWVKNRSWQKTRVKGDIDMWDVTKEKVTFWLFYVCLALSRMFRLDLDLNK